MYSPEALEHVYNLLSTHELMVEVFVKGKAYIEKHIFENLDQVGITESHIRYVRKTRQPYKNVLNMMIKNKENIENININFANKQDRKLIKEKLMELKHITITSSSDHNIEIGGETTSKASALKVLCNKLEVSPECIMACGDSTNDEDMLKVAGLPVAMGNAKDSVKAMAKYITSTNDEDGVAAAIKKFAFK
ncbi:HAD-IIB family hydrolase [Aminipila terrae]|uniref:HAD-IIB family hydrolase n=1 Tax=Aminipila terrae TaxID=2697030 RepID=A0A6P1MGZ2_9FIRM|nr:HAD-IIB family hydrolase [Aminipila terrae]QHI73157.1 HAD-IIB family hydrolase [Aminipila terrae]